MSPNLNMIKKKSFRVINVTRDGKYFHVQWEGRLVRFKQDPRRPVKPGQSVWLYVDEQRQRLERTLF